MYLTGSSFAYRTATALRLALSSVDLRWIKLRNVQNFVRGFPIRRPETEVLRAALPCLLCLVLIDTAWVLVLWSLLPTQSAVRMVLAVSQLIQRC
ncbi:hypothetical protein DAEQUDRAFT_375156 [Daedalea quercina L-15889]|uniref:Uncharacterized protein n=1 Tax=Daedalea quercina L-15889 TaxID=1314783 RepID=A0A165P7F4_9APHY|nr:hypothetical protein DAEQUDRAFT_375156 [Daedalea quercina L-15889]